MRPLGGVLPCFLWFFFLWLSSCCCVFISYRSISVPPVRGALTFIRRTIEDRLAQCDRLEAALREAVVNWRFYPAVLALQAMRGVQFTTAVGMLAELHVMP